MEPRSLVVTFCNQRSTPSLCVAVVEIPSARMRWLDIGSETPDQIGATGIASATSGFFVALQSGHAATVNRYGTDGTLQASIALDHARDVHALAYEDERRCLSVASTGTDTVLRCHLSESESEVVRQEAAPWPGAGRGKDDRGDRLHLTSLAFHEGAQLATMFGVPSEAATGAVVDVESGEVLAASLAEPHSLRSAGDGLWFVESGIGRVHQLRKNGAHHTSRPYRGYLRGLALADDLVLVGVSDRARGVPSALLALDRESLELRLRVPLAAFGREIYDLHLVPPMDWEVDTDPRDRRIEALERHYEESADRAHQRLLALDRLHAERDALAARTDRVHEIEEGLALARADLARLQEARALDHERAGQWRASYERLKSRRVVRIALRVANTAGPVYRLVRRVRGTA